MGNNDKTPDEGVFGSALANQKLVDETFFLDFSSDQTIAQNLHQSDEVVQGKIRQLMRNAKTETQFLFDFKTYGSELDSEVAQDLIEGEIAAIDSSDMLPITDLMNTSFYAVGVGCITSQNRSTPEIVLTSTNTRYATPEEIVVTNDNSDLFQLCDELDRTRQTKGSWATTFREYQEREVAIACQQNTVLLDGPIFTQNLITQRQGQELYSRMMQTEKRFIGVIKDLGSSWAICKWTAMSLEREEGFVLCPIQQQYQIRFGEIRSINDWLQQLPGKYVRVVYRPAEKAFAFECALHDLPYAVSLLRQDASPTVNHEIPLLLETVDSHLRGSNNSQAIKQSFITEIQRNNYRMGVDITNERDYR
ncbi:hypothetical protein JJD41_03320 [Oxynema sp. CENA135]|uniref:hypothetical protein n=1 Tax=Oxynema sp. CENA135 TaxID=984206 RepID=UPI00190C300E|nr:hypothetical protein [Oxynema sp. CENA135]MBK4728922.1 hypothetical protein [Oxynema sp. CENA135]